MKFNVGDVVTYRFNHLITKHLEIGRVIEVIKPNNYIIELLIYIKGRYTLIQNIDEWYLSKCNIDDYTYLLDNPIYTTTSIFDYVINHVGTREIPKSSIDAITFEDINEGDVLIDFLRTSNKTEYDFNAYYKESHLDFFLKNRKNLFTGLPIDKQSIVKYTCLIK